MTNDVVSILTNQTGAVIVAGIFTLYITNRDKSDQKIHSGYLKVIAQVSKTLDRFGKKIENLGDRIKELKEANEAVYKQNYELNKKNKEYKKNQETS